MLSEIILNLYQNGVCLTPKLRNTGAAQRKDLAQVKGYNRLRNVQIYSLNLPDKKD